MGYEVAHGGGCGIDEPEPEVVTEVYEATCLAHMVGCDARPVGPPSVPGEWGCLGSILEITTFRVTAIK